MGVVNNLASEQKYRISITLQKLPFERNNFKNVVSWKETEIQKD